MYVTGDDSYESISEATQVVAPTTETQQGEVTQFPIEVQFDTLLSQNPDTVGWIYGPDSVLNYPIVQGTDNDYYMNHLFSGEQNNMGALFMEFTNQAAMTDQNTFIYGHHMRNGSMFGDLDLYHDQAYYEAHPVLYYATPTQNYYIELVAGYMSDGYQILHTNYNTDEEFMQYAADIKAQSTFDSGLELYPEDRLISLYTCMYDYDEARYILVGKLIPWEEDPTDTP